MLNCLYRYSCKTNYVVFILSIDYSISYYKILLYKIYIFYIEVYESVPRRLKSRIYHCICFRIKCAKLYIKMK